MATLKDTIVLGNLSTTGTLNATTIYENGTLLDNKYAAKSHTHTKSQITDFSHTHSKSEVGLGNVDNTADANKSVKYATQLGYYDTITANSDGTYTITRQTGYVDLGSLDFGYYAEVFYCLLPTKASSGSATNWLNSKYGNATRGADISIGQDKTMQITQSGEYISIKDTTFTDPNAFKVSVAGVMLQYELATSYTEKVEKNHYAAYNQKFILDHNKSEAERSANVFNIDAINPNKTSYVEKISDTEFKATWANYELFKTNFKENTQYTISGYVRDDVTTYHSRLVIFYTDNTTEEILVGNGTSYIYKTHTSKANKTINYISHSFETGDCYSYYKNLMINEGSVALPYQPYEGKVVHEKDLDNKFGTFVTTDTHQTISSSKTFSGNQIFTGYLDIRGTAAEKHLKTRGIGGSDGNGNEAELYLQYNSSYPTKFGSSGNSSLNSDGTITENGELLSNKYAAKSHTHTKSQVGLGNVDNTADANKSVKYATSAGTANSVPEANLTWGGKNFAGEYGPIDAAMVPSLGANRLAFVPAAGVTVEYSRDAGSTWTDYGLNNTQKTALFSGPQTNTGAVIGKPSRNSSTNKYENVSVNNRLRVTLKSDTAHVYTALNKFVIYCSTSGSTGCKCTIQGLTKNNYDAGNNSWTTFADGVDISGWSGFNVINTSSIITYGNNGSQYIQIRFTFYCGGNSSMETYGGLSIINIYGFGGVGWTTPSNMAKWGQLYSYDAGQNVFFPASTYSTTFYENGTSLANKYAAKSHTHTKSQIADFPTIPTVNNPTITINQGGTKKGSFTLNQSGATTIDLTDNNTTYSAGTGLSLSGTTFSVSSANVSTMMNLLSEGTSDPTDNDYYISQWVGGGTTTTTYHRRPVSKLYNYMKGKFDSVYQAKGNYLPLSGGTLTGKLYINAPLNAPGSSDPSLAINYSTSAQTINDANLNMIKFGSLDNYIGEAPASRTIEGIPAFAFHTTMGDNSEFAWLSAGWDHRMSLGKGGLTLHKGKLTLADDIAYKGAKSSGSIIKFMNNTADIYGNGIRIGGGGATIIGGGESADLPSVSGGDEVLYLMNDGNIDFYSNCQDGLSSAKHMTFDTAGTLNVPTDVVGTSTSNRLIFRHLDGQNCNGDYNLYLQYHQPNTKIYLNGSTYYIENGYYYNGISEQANLINPHQNISSTGRSTWDPTSSGKIIWGQKFANSNISNDTGDLTLFLRPSVYSSGATELCMNIDGDYYSMGTKLSRDGHTHSKSEVGLGNVDNTADANKSVNYANSAGSANYANSAGSVAWDNISSKPITITQRNNDSPVSGAYAWGTHVTMRNTNNWFEIYAPDTGTSNSRIYMQTGWDNARQGWKEIAWTSDIPTSLPANGGNADYANSANHANSANRADYADSAGSANSVAWGNVSGKPSTFPPDSHTHPVDSLLKSNSNNPVRNSTIYSAFSSVVDFDSDKYTYGNNGSWRLRQYHATGNTLDIRYGNCSIDAQEKTYDVSFSKPIYSTNYAIVCGIYRDNRNSWFWSPLVKKKTESGFSVYVRGNTGGDNSGTLFYIAIKSN